MLNKFLPIWVLILLLITSCNYQQSNDTDLMYGQPFLGYTEHFEQLLVMELDKDVSNIKVEYWSNNDRSNAQSISMDCELTKK